MRILIYLISILYSSIQVCVGTEGESYLQTICDGAEKCANNELAKNLRSINFQPTTEDELNLYCPPLVEAMWCIVKECVFNWTSETTIPNSSSETSTPNNSSEITTPNSSIPKHGQYPYKRHQLNLGGMLLEICTKGSQLRQDYLSEVSCFNEMFSEDYTNQNCRRNESSIESSLNFTIASELEKMTDRTCMWNLYYYPCVGATNRSICGDHASDMVMNFLKEVPFLQQFCTDSDAIIKQMIFLKFLHLDKDEQYRLATLLHSFDPEEPKNYSFSKSMSIYTLICTFIIMQYILFW